VALLLVAGGLTVFLVTRGDDGGPTAGDPSTTTDREPSDRPSGANLPEVGDCRDMSYEVATAESDDKDAPVVDCGEAHTARTFYVGEYDRGSEPDQHAIAVECLTRLPASLGVSPQEAARTAYTTVFFWPTADQQAAGEHWYRCDIAIVSGTGMKPLPDELYVPKPLPAKYAACRTSAEVAVTCDEPHAFRAVGAWNITLGAAASDADLLADGQDHCPDEAVWYSWPSAETRSAGYAWGVCYVAEQED